MNKKTKQKILVVSTNIGILTILAFFQNKRYSQILSFKFENEDSNEILRHVSILNEYGNATNYIISTSIVLLLINFLLLKKWAESKKWMLEGVLIFIITLIIGLAYNHQIVKGL